jgi:SAM-dependent methyltransferase
MSSLREEPRFKRVQQGHLGGYIVGGDPATWYPELWQWLVDSHGVRSVLDVGCGEGHAIEFFRSIGCDVLGVEGVQQDSPVIVQHDYTTGPYKPPHRFDLVWACEFVEHVEEKYLSNFLTTFRVARRLLLMTHASPGQGGYHHVNEQGEEYWISRIEQAGFRYEEELTSITRNLSRSNVSPWNHYLRSGLAFRPTPGIRSASAI